jgi:hypothetical protein
VVTRTQLAERPAGQQQERDGAEGARDAERAEGIRVGQVTEPYADAAVRRLVAETQTGGAEPGQREHVQHGGQDAVAAAVVAGHPAGHPGAESDRQQRDEQRGDRRARRERRLVLCPGGGRRVVAVPQESCGGEQAA